MVRKIGSLKDSGRLVSRNRHDFDGLSVYSNELKPYLDEEGFVFVAGASEYDSKNFLAVFLGRGIEVEYECLHSTILTENRVDLTDNRIFKEKNSETRALGLKAGKRGTYHFFNDIFEHEILSIFSRLRKFAEDKCRPQEKAMKLAYGELYDTFRSSPRSFGITSGLVELVTVMIPHEFHHDKIVETSEVPGDVREASAYLYALASAKTPEGVFANLNCLYGLTAGGNAQYDRAGSLGFDYLRKAGYSERDWLFLEREKIADASGTILGQAKDALNMLERDYGLPSHEDVERELKPDFEKYGAMVMHAVVGKLGAI